VSACRRRCLLRRSGCEGWTIAMATERGGSSLRGESEN
jgi:hypothetical protein